MLHDDEYHKKDGERLFARACSGRKGGMSSTRRRVGLRYVVRYEEEIFYCKVGEALAEIAQRSSGFPIPASV